MYEAKAGDTLVITTDMVLKAEQRTALEKALKDGGISALVLDGGLRVNAVIRKG